MPCFFFKPERVGPSGKGLGLRYAPFKGLRFNTSWVQTISWGHTP